MTNNLKQNLYALMLAFLVFLTLLFIWLQIYGAAIGPAFLAFLIYISKLKKTKSVDTENTNKNIDKNDY